MCLSSHLCQLGTLQWAAIGTGDAALPLKLLWVCGGAEGRKKCGIGKSVSAQKASFEKDSSLLLRIEHMPTLPSHPQGRLKVM